MKEMREQMGMPVVVEIADPTATQAALNSVFDYFKYIDDKFSTYKSSSEITKINSGRIKPENYSKDMKEVFALAEETKKETDGYFDIRPVGKCDPSGLVKGWAIFNAANLLRDQGFDNFYVEAGGDIETSGKNKDGKPWHIGIRNPFNPAEIVKVVRLSGKGVATSGTYLRGQHIYNPKKPGPIKDIVSLTVIGPNIYEADRFATAAFAMGVKGIEFISGIKGLEGYQIDIGGRAVFTPGFEAYAKTDA